MFRKALFLMAGAVLLLPGAAFAQDPTFAFASALGGTSLDSGTSIAVDGLGNVYTTGFFAGTADFDPGAGTVNLTSAGSNDIFVSKLSFPPQTPAAHGKALLLTALALALCIGFAVRRSRKQAAS